MDHSLSLYPTSAPSNPPSSLPRQNKVILQRQYREKEAECFNTLRDVINELTGEELHKRQDILQKAIGLLLTALEVRKLKEVQAIPPTSYEAHAHTGEYARSAHIGHPAELSHWPQRWQSIAGFDSQLANVTQPHDQQHHLMCDANEANSRVYGEDWSNYFQS